jgi:SAM-dependent methyltransferase
MSADDFQISLHSK